MKPRFAAHVVNTLNLVRTGIYYTNKKGERREKLLPVVLRRLFLTALPGAALIGLPANCRIVRVNRKGEVTYSLSGRKEHEKPWWDKSPTDVDDHYSRIESMKRAESRA